MRLDMRHKAKGQSLVEMALMLPLFLVVIFGIIDMGYYIYGFSTIYNAARNASDVAAEIPPYPSKLNTPSDDCVKRVRDTVTESTGILGDFNTSGSIQISFPTNKRALGEPIQVRVEYRISPLTPLFQLVPIGDEQGRMTVIVEARRSIETLGNGPVTTRNPNGIVCRS
jgi:hypothetical protein